MQNIRTTYVEWKRYVSVNIAIKPIRVMTFVAGEKGRVKIMIDVDKRKKEIAAILDKIELDIKTLQNNILKLRADMVDVDENTDFEKFDDEHDIERDLKYIRLC